MEINLQQAFFLALGILVLIIHTYAWVTPNDFFFTAFPSFDKIEHFMSGFVLGGLVCVTVKKPSIILVLGIVLGLGVLWEIVETYLLYDTSTDILLDLTFNELGALIASLLLLKK